MSVLFLEEARLVSLDDKRADIIRSAARGQGPTFIAAKLDMLIEAVRTESAIEVGRLNILIETLRADLADAREAEHEAAMVQAELTRQALKRRHGAEGR
jgi:hypothetical protein